MSAWGHPQYQQSLEALTAQQDRDHEKTLDTVRLEAEVSIMVDAAPETVKKEGGARRGAACVEFGTMCSVGRCIKRMKVLLPASKFPVLQSAPLPQST